MKRDIRNESLFNLLFRVVNFSTKRLRGRVYVLLKIFSSCSGKRIYIEKGVRLKNSKLMHIGNGVKLGLNARLECFSYSSLRGSVKLTIGVNSSFGDYFHLGCAEKVTVGENVLVGSNVLITDHNHGSSKDLKQASLTQPKQRELISSPVIIEDNVWICDGAIILPGTTIGEGAIIAANTVARGNIRPRTLYLGVLK